MKLYIQIKYKSKTIRLRYLHNVLLYQLCFWSAYLHMCCAAIALRDKMPAGLPATTASCSCTDKVCESCLTVATVTCHLQPHCTCVFGRVLPLPLAWVSVTVTWLSHGCGRVPGLSQDWVTLQYGKGACVAKLRSQLYILVNYFLIWTVNRDCLAMLDSLDCGCITQWIWLSLCFLTSLDDHDTMFKLT
jgi:hypothetical protein